MRHCYEPSNLSLLLREAAQSVYNSMWPINFYQTKYTDYKQNLHEQYKIIWG